MSKSGLLRLQDVRQAYRLIGDCRDLASTPELWQQRMFDGLCTLVGADRTTGGEGLWPRPERPLKILSVYWSGFDQSMLQHLLDYLREGRPASDPILNAFQHIPAQLVTRARRQLVPDRIWYGSDRFNDYHRPADCDHQLTSVFQVSAQGAISCVGLHRHVGARDFSFRERRLLHFFHGEIGGLIGRVLVSVTERPPDGLSRRLRQTLHYLMEGDSEKQVAARLGLSHATAHQYVTDLYRRFGVHSRAELMAYVMRRLGQRQWKALLHESDN